jgi:hypothetical protein
VSAPHGGGAGELIIASAADSGYFPLLKDSVSSVRALHTDVPIGVFDIGLTPEQCDWLRSQSVQVLKPDWDLDFPGMDKAPEVLKAEFARPFLPRHFPGYRMYFWLDADAWLQDWRTVELYCRAAGTDKLAIVPEIDRAYKRHYKRPKLFGRNLGWKNYREAFGWRVADRLGRNPTVNCGVLALHAEAPHWEAWQRALAKVLQRTHFTPAGQTAMNYVVFAEKLPVNLLPSYCNWMPGDAAPAFDMQRGLFVEPYAPHEVIGVMHLAGAPQKDLKFRLERLDGGFVETLLRYSATRELTRRPSEAA